MYTMYAWITHTNAAVTVGSLFTNGKISGLKLRNGKH